MSETPTTVRVTIEPDSDPDLSWLAQDCWNEATPTEPEGYGRRRIKSYGVTWACVGVVVDVLCPHGGVMDSASLWGIEDDWDTDSDWYQLGVAVELATALEVSITPDTLIRTL
tara:strand:+ start:1068 stop:1406 length:339 start_codon:yes stop_codon:yes gene_type:complete